MCDGACRCTTMMGRQVDPREQLTKPTGNGSTEQYRAGESALSYNHVPRSSRSNRKGHNNDFYHQLIISPCHIGCLQYESLHEGH